MPYYGQTETDPQEDIDPDFLQSLVTDVVVDDTNKPENNDKNEEKCWIDLPHEGLAIFNLPVSLSLDAPCLGD